jgi:hypothetical protein
MSLTSTIKNFVYPTGANPTTLGANPTIVSYNASAVKIYNATSSGVRFENKKCFRLL